MKHQISRTISCILVLASIASICAWNAHARVAEPSVKNKPSDVDIPFYTVEKGTKSGIREPERLAIEEEEEWLAMWPRHRTGMLKADAAQPMDFEHCMVIAVFQGEDSSNSGFVEIQSVKLLPDKVLVIRRESYDKTHIYY